MNKNKNRGFTLVELLAVIVILAVVILIAVTAVIPRMNKAKKNALVDEALVYLNAAKEAYIFDSEDTGSRCINISDLNGEYVSKDSSDYNGVIKVSINNDDISYIINLTDGKYYLTGTGNLTSNDVKDAKPQGFATSCGEYNPVIADGADTNTLAYKLLMNEGGATLGENLSIIDNRTSSVNFNNAETSAANSGLYKYEDNIGATYYYRGAVSNNWVEFGGFYWRIMRINGDGSIRMIYSGLKNSSHTGDEAAIKNSSNTYNSRYGYNVNNSVKTNDISGLTNTQITTYYGNGRYGNTYVGYMYNPYKELHTYPTNELNTSTRLNYFPNYTNIYDTTNYYLFKSFNFSTDCITGDATNEEGACTLVCRNLGDDCIYTNWNNHASNPDNYSTTLPGVYPTTNPTQTVYTSDYKYTCWGTSTAVTKSNSDGTTSVYISCPIVSEILGTIQGNATAARVRYHGFFSQDAASAHSNVSDSALKREVDIWYENNILNKNDGKSTPSSLESYLADEIYCNDRTNNSTSFPFSGSNYGGMSAYVYSAYSKFVNASTVIPDVKCNKNINDRLSLSSGSSNVSPNGYGNGALKYPVGVISLDDVALAGGKYNTDNSNYYLYTGKMYWTMTPWTFGSTSLIAYTGIVAANGRLLYTYGGNTAGVRPVINLSKDVLYDSGLGTEANPYKVKLSS
ncbi:MAG: type II secretion system protein [Bacilli bacterium]|nr:type II secretion system protein [Bacilli bacterium]